MANGHGGARSGSGRKPAAVKYPKPVATAEKKIVDKLPQLVDRMIQLAEGGFEVVTDTLEPAGTIMIDGTHTDHTDHGPRTVKIKELAFPDKDPDELVLVKRVASIAAPDRAAAEYLIDRIMGKPTERIEQETEVTGKITVTSQAEGEASKRLSKWREEQKTELQKMKSSSPVASPTSPTSSTTT